MQAKWQGIEMPEVYLDWAEALQDYSLGAIDGAINLSRAEQHPPNQGEFIIHCHRYKPPLIELRLEKPVTPDLASKVNDMKTALVKKVTA